MVKTSSGNGSVLEWRKYKKPPERIDLEWIMETIRRALSFPNISEASEEDQNVEEGNVRKDAVGKLSH